MRRCIFASMTGSGLADVDIVCLPGGFGLLWVICAGSDGALSGRGIEGDEADEAIGKVWEVACSDAESICTCSLCSSDEGEGEEHSAECASCWMTCSFSVSSALRRA